MRIDFWYGDGIEAVAMVDSFYNGCVCVGNLYNSDGKVIGDYVADDSAKVEKMFPGIFGRYGGQKE